MATMTNELMEQREQSDACIDSAESRQKKAEVQQIEQKKQQLKQLAAEMNAIVKELQEAGEWPLDEDDLDKAAGGIRYADKYHVEMFNERTPDGGIQYSNEELDRIMKKYMSKGWGCTIY